MKKKKKKFWYATKCSYYLKYNVFPNDCHNIITIPFSVQTFGNSVKNSNVNSEKHRSERNKNIDELKHISKNL